MTTKTKAILGLGLVAGLGAGVLPLASYAADTNSKSADVVVAVEESITITAINNQALGLDLDGSDISSGKVESGTHTVTISTSAVNGYGLTMKSASADLKLQNTGDATIYDGASGFTGIGAATGAGMTAPSGAGYQEAKLTSGLGKTFAATAPANGTWGFRLAGFAGANEYISVPTVDTLIAQSDAPAGSQNTVVTFAAQAGTTTPAGSYGAKITYTATTK